MGIDAVILLRPKTPQALRGVLDPERDTVDVLDDRALLLSTFIGYRAIEADPDEGRAILTHYGDALVRAHDDDRGILFFPDLLEPKGRTYDTIVAQVGASGTWVPACTLNPAELRARQAKTRAEVERLLAMSEKLQRGEPVPEIGIPKVPALEDAQAQLSALLSGPNVLERLVATMSEGTAVLLIQRPSRRALTATYGGLHETGAFALPDGTWVIPTDRGGSDAEEMAALALGESLREWVDEHRDPRGVPTFRSSRLDVVRSAPSYEGALVRLGDAVRFVTPHTIEDVIEARRRRFREYLAS
jgi:hypothetical protein